MHMIYNVRLTYFFVNLNKKVKIICICISPNILVCMRCMFSYAVKMIRNITLIQEENIIVIQGIHKEPSFDCHTIL